MSGTKRIALFDFDGTITTKDTLFEFIRFYHGNFKFLVGFTLLSPMLTLFKLGFIPNQRAKELVLKYFFYKVSLSDFTIKCNDFANRYIPKLIRPLALKEINNHLENETSVVVISASPENWVKPWCDQLGIQCLASKLQIEDGLLTGLLLGKNCYGQEKVNRIKQSVSIKDFEEIYAYGDSSGDKELLKLSTHSYYKPFRKK